MNNTELEAVYQNYLATKQQIDALNRELNQLKNTIIEAHNGEPTMLTEHYVSKLTPCTRLTLLEKQVQQKYNITFAEDDYKSTPYDRLTVQPIKA